MTDQPDLSTTAGKIADLRARYQEAVVDAEETRADQAAREGQAHRAPAHRDCSSIPGASSSSTSTCATARPPSAWTSSRPYGDSVVTGVGTIHGRTVAVYAQDFSTFGGSLGEVAGEKIIKVMEFALRGGMPIIGILDSGGARIQEGVVALGKYGEIFRLNTRASGVIPQISIIMGPAAGGAVYSPALTDFVIMVDKTSQMFVTGPDVIKTVTGEDVGMEELGGAYTHNTRSGVAHYLAEDEDDAIDYARTLLGFLPDNNMAELPVYESVFEFETTDADRFLNTIIPDSAEPAVRHPHGDRARRRRRRLPRGAAAVRTEHRDRLRPRRGAHRRASSRTSRRRWPAPSTSRPARRPAASCGSATRSRSRSSLSSMCPATCRAPTRSGTGVIRRGAKLLYAYAEATVPLVTVILRKAYGGAYIVMGSKQLGADINLAWPTAEIAVMGGQGAVNILYRGEIKRAEEAGEDVAAVRTRLANEYTYDVASPFLAAERGELDGIIEPAQTRVSDREGAARAARQAREPAAEEAREHPAVTGDATDPVQPRRTAMTRSTCCAARPRQTSSRH